MISGAAAGAQTNAWPWPQCPVTPDPSGLARPSILTFATAIRFGDNSTTEMSRTTCRDSGAVLLWTWVVTYCNGPCEAAMYPATVESWLPPDVPHACDGCLYPRRRAVSDH